MGLTALLVNILDLVRAYRGAAATCSMDTVRRTRERCRAARGTRGTTSTGPGLGPPWRGCPTS